MVDGHGAQHLAVGRVDVPQADLRVVRARQQVPLPEAAPCQAVALQVISAEVCVPPFVRRSQLLWHLQDLVMRLQILSDHVGLTAEDSSDWPFILQNRGFSPRVRGHSHLRLMAGKPDVGGAGARLLRLAGVLCVVEDIHLRIHL